MICIGIRVPTLASWDEPATYADAKRAGHADVSWRVRILGSGAVFLLAYLNWLFHHERPDWKLGPLRVSLGMAAFIAAYGFFLLPLMFRGAPCTVCINALGIHWVRGFRGGSISFHEADGFSWRNDASTCVLSVSRKDGGVPFEVGVPDTVTKEKVSEILSSRISSGPANYGALTPPPPFPSGSSRTPRRGRTAESR